MQNKELMLLLVAASFFGLLANAMASASTGTTGLNTTMNTTFSITTSTTSSTSSTTSSTTSTNSTLSSTSSSTTSTASSATTTSSTTSLTTSTTSLTTTVQATGTTLQQQGGRYTGGFLDTGSNATFLSTGSPVRQIAINLTSSNLVLNLSLTNQSAQPASFRGFGGTAYQYIMINGSVGNGQDNIDQYVQSVTYNFSVPKSWLQQKGASPGSISLFKYQPNGPDWIQLPTALTGSDGANYYYSATSLSLSGYTIGFTTATHYSTGALPALTPLTLSTTFNTFLFASAGVAATTGSATAFSANFIQFTSNEFESSTKHNANIVALGYNSYQVGSGAPQSGNLVLPTGYGTYNTVYAGIAANVIFGNNAVEVNTVTTAAAQANSLSYTVGVANSVVFLLYGIAGTTISSVRIPDTAGNGCTAATIKSTGTDVLASAAIANCFATGTGTFRTNTLSSSSAAFWPNAITAIVFPPYGLWLEDVPTTGNIATSPCPFCDPAYNQQNGNVVNVIGDNTLKPIAPTGYTFTSYTVDTKNTVNVILWSNAGGTGGATNAITVMGNAIITATYTQTLAASSLSASNSIADQGQQEKISYSWTGGTSTFKTNVMISNSLDTFPIICQSIATTTSPASVSCALPLTSNALGPSVSITGNVVDTSVPPANIHTSGTISIEPQPTVTIARTYAVLDSGQTQTLTTTHNTGGGAGTFTDQFYNVTGALTYNTVPGIAVAGTATNTFTTSSPTANNVFTWNVISTDTGTTSGYVFNGVAITFAVNTVLATPTISPSAPSIDNGQSITLTGSTGSGGSSPYSYQWYSDGTCTSAVSGQTSTTYSPSPASTTTYSFKVTDSASNPSSRCSSGDTVTVNSKPSVTLATNSLVDDGQSQVFTATLSGGTGTFKVQFYNETGSLSYNTVPGVAVSGTATNTQIIHSPTDSNTFTWNAIVTDTGTSSSASPNPYVFNSVGSQSGTLWGTIFTANTAFSLTSETPSPTSQNQGNSEKLTIVIAGGTSSYSYNFMVVNTNVDAALGGGTNIIYKAVNTNSFRSNVISFTLSSDTNDIGTVTFQANVVDGATLAQVVTGSTTFTVVRHNCIPAITNTLITFPNTQPGSFASTANAENVVNEGNIQSNIIVFGGAAAGDTTGNWMSTTGGTSSFLVTNTLFSFTKSSLAAVGNELANIITAPAGQDTNVLVPANGGSNVIYFGLNVPIGQAADTYNQLITVAASC